MQHEIGWERLSQGLLVCDEEVLGVVRVLQADHTRSPLEEQMRHSHRRVEDRIYVRHRDVGGVGVVVAPMFVLIIFSTFGNFWANFERPDLGCIETDFCD